VIWLWVVFLVLLIGAIAIVAAGRDTSIAPSYEDRPDQAVPSGRALTADDLANIRFTPALRGYRMDEVDALLDRLRTELGRRESVASGAEPTESLVLETKPSHRKPVESSAAAEPVGPVAPVAPVAPVEPVGAGSANESDDRTTAITDSTATESSGAANPPAAPRRRNRL
jgi:DivIVA domain-containing protein